MKSQALLSLALIAGFPILSTATPVKADIKADPVQVAPSGSTPTTAAPWQPIARIDPNRPYTIQILNQSETLVEYSSTTNEFSPRQLAPGSRTTLARLPVSLYLLINPIDAQLRLKYSVSASNNVITIQVTQLLNNQPGNTTVNIQETGGIYVY